MQVFGSTNEDKGNQLENFVVKILERMGFTLINKNVIRLGGSEIDVVAEFKLPGLGTNPTHKLLCECKAQKKPNDLTDWQKFLGKVLTCEALHKLPVHGYFVSLGGVNGNVTGHYEDLQSHKPHIKIVNEEELAGYAESIFGVCKIEKVASSVRRFTDLQPKSYDVVLCNYKAFWMVFFQNDKYSFLEATGEPLDDETATELQQLAKPTISASKYLNLASEAEAKQRFVRLCKSILACIILNSGHATQSQIYEFCDEYSSVEINAAVEELARNGLMYGTETSRYTLGPGDSKFDFEQTLKMYRFLVPGQITQQVIDVFGCELHRDLINDNFLEGICNLQGGFPLPLQDGTVCLSILQMSISGVAWAIVPDVMLVGHREELEANKQHIEELSNPYCRNYFVNTLQQCLYADFQRPQLSEMFYTKYGLSGLETATRLVAKFDNGVVLDSETDESFILGELTPGFLTPEGNRFAIMRGFTSGLQSRVDSEPKPLEANPEESPLQGPRPDENSLLGDTGTE